MPSAGPAPSAGRARGPSTAPGLVFLRRREGHWPFGRRSARRFSEALPALAEQLGSNVNFHKFSFRLLGPSPQRQGALLPWLFSERWSATGRLRRWLAFALNRHHIFLRFAPAIERDALPRDCPPAIAERRLLRLLRQHFLAHREALLGRTFTAAP